MFRPLNKKYNNGNNLPVSGEAQIIKTFDRNLQEWREIWGIWSTNYAIVYLEGQLLKKWS